MLVSSDIVARRSKQNNQKNSKYFFYAFYRFSSVAQLCCCVPLHLNYICFITTESHLLSNEFNSKLGANREKERENLFCFYIIFFLLLFIYSLAKVIIRKDNQVCKMEQSERKRRQNNGNCSPVSRSQGIFSAFNSIEHYAVDLNKLNFALFLFYSPVFLMRSAMEMMKTNPKLTTTQSIILNEMEKKNKTKILLTLEDLRLGKTNELLIDERKIYIFVLVSFSLLDFLFFPIFPLFFFLFFSISIIEMNCLATVRRVKTVISIVV